MTTNTARPMRIRFAPSPTGPLHIGGVRTALYNYLLARKHGGTFLLRVEDTDQTRFVAGAEQYIIDTLRWCGIEPTEGLGFGDGAHAPYRQSERKAMYRQYAETLVANGWAYYAFDTPADLEAMRAALTAESAPNLSYSPASRMRMQNSFTLAPEVVAERLAAGADYVIRFRIPDMGSVDFHDAIRGDISVPCSVLDDKVLLKADGMPTYHLANVVDDYLMEISHVIRGEEWLASAPLHVLLYRAFGWEASMPVFAHLSLLLKPDGNGKLSKRDGDRLGFPVFPLNWYGGENGELTASGFRERGFLPAALLNFLALQGWNPGTEQELMTLEEMTTLFSLDKVVQSGARFDYTKALWFNQQYIAALPAAELSALLLPYVVAEGYTPTNEYLTAVAALYRERLHTLSEFWEQAAFLFAPVRAHDPAALATVQKKWSAEKRPLFDALVETLQAVVTFDAHHTETAVKAFMETHTLKPADVFPLLRFSLCGTLKGAGVFEVVGLLGKAETLTRLAQGFAMVCGK